MFRVLEINAAGDLSVTEGDARVAPPPEGTFRWVDLAEQNERQLAVLGQRFGFHPLTLEDCAHVDQRPKLEQYDGYLFLVTHGFLLQAGRSSELESLELHTFLGQRYLVTVHVWPINALEDVWKRVQTDKALATQGPDFVVYLIADQIADGLFPLVDVLADEVEGIEDAVLRHRGASCLGDIFRLKRLLVSLRRVLSPQRNMFALLTRHGGDYIADRTAIYFRDVHDHVVRIHESVEATRDLLGNALDAYLWSASQRTNEIMKRLTLLSAIFLPLTFITGFFGQNFEDLPFCSHLMFVGMLVACRLCRPACCTSFCAASGSDRAECAEWSANRGPAVRLLWVGTC